MFYSGRKTGLELCERRISFSDCQVVKQCLALDELSVHQVHAIRSLQSLR